MDKKLLYHEIAETVRQDLLKGRLNPGDRLPSVRAMTTRWHCTPGTVQRAYQILVSQGLAVSRPGQGTHLIASVTLKADEPLRKAALVHRAEEFLLETLSAGHTPSEVEQAVRMALDRWRALSESSAKQESGVLRFVGSHDPAVALIASRPEIAVGSTLQLSFTGSLGGLIALATGNADLAGSHLWDEQTGEYNVSFVRRLLPGKKVALLTLHHRRLGFMVKPGNPLGIREINDLTRPDIRFANRQEGSGTRVWLESKLAGLKIAPSDIHGYEDIMRTHTEVAQAVAEDRANVGLGVETTALAYGLDFILMTRERYDIVIPADNWETGPILALRTWLNTPEARESIMVLGGYDTEETGHVRWVP